MERMNLQRKQPVGWDIMLIYGLVLLFAINFLDEAGIIISAAFLFAFVRFPKLKVDATSIGLLFFGIFYLFSLYMYESLSLDLLIKFLILPFGTYYVGYTLGANDHRKDTSYRIVRTLAVGFFIHAMLNASSFIRIHGVSFNEPYRFAYEFWRNNSIISVTASNLYYTPMAFFAIGVILAKTPWYSKLTACTALGMIVLSMLLYQNRTTIVLLAAIVAFAVIVDFFRRGIHSKLSWCAIVLLLILILVFMKDVGGIKTWVMGTRLYERLSEEGVDRSDIWLSFLQGDWWKYPFGGRKVVLLAEKSYVHNMWLDTWWRVGIIPFAILFVFSIETIIVVMRRKESNIAARDAIQRYFVMGMLLNLCVEPVLEANPFIFYILTMICGAKNSEYAHCRL